METSLAFIGAATIEETLELLAARCDDPSPAVYDRLFKTHPDMKPYFWRDTTGAIKGEMLTRTFEAILDFIGERNYAHLMIGTEMVTHEGYDVQREIFITFFETIRDTVRDLLTDAWSPAYEQAWLDLLAEIDSFAKAVPRTDANAQHNRDIHATLVAGGWAQPDNG